MLSILRFVTRLVELVLSVPARIASVFLVNVAFNPRLGALRYLVWLGMAYVAFALVLVYVVAPVRGYVGAWYLHQKLTYDAERWLATAIYDRRRDFVGIFDSRLDSQRDVNFTGDPIEIGSYTANPDHKSIPVRAVPDLYWRCLVYHEDRHLGTWRNPSGIDLAGVLKIPLTTINRSLRTGGLRGGVGGSTLPMQLVRVIYKTPPRVDETPWEKIGRKLGEWWMAPVIYHALTQNGDRTKLKQWAANHLWLAQRTGGAPLHGIEVTSRIVFGKEAKDLSDAEQLVLASAVNKPIILLPGSDRLNAVRLDRWRYILEVRASQCAEQLIDDPERRKRTIVALVDMAGGPPDPKVRPRLQAALDAHAPGFAKRAEANPRLRANALMPAARLGLREELKQAFGLNWRLAVRGVTTTVDAAQNLAFRSDVTDVLKKLDRRWSSALKPGFTLDPDRVDSSLDVPDITLVAADASGRIVRYYEARQTATYFGAIAARDPSTGAYRRNLESRAIASTGKVLAAIAIANTGRDRLSSGYLDVGAPARGLETCRRNGTLRRLRTAQVSFACSLNGPIEWRSAQVGQRLFGRLIQAFRFTPPPVDPSGEPTPPSTAAVRGLIAGSPRRVHHMSAVVLAALTGSAARSVRPPTLISRIDVSSPLHAEAFAKSREPIIRPNSVIKRSSRPLIKALLAAPLCYRANGRNHGTLRQLAHWCASRRGDLRLHFAKTGTQVNEDPDETVDVWATGGLQFTNGAAYSYVALIGTGTPRRPFARQLHASQVAAPLLDVLLRDLAKLARKRSASATPQPSNARSTQRRFARSRDN
ncbi:MAG: transglycosylase domain-containing protein [Pseudomonadota bacterium]